MEEANLKFQQSYPGDRPDRQAVHTVYGGANLFKSDTTKRMGEIALSNLKTYAPNFAILANVLHFKDASTFTTGEKEIEGLERNFLHLHCGEGKTEPGWLLIQSITGS